MVNIERTNIQIRLYNKEVIFNVCKYIKKPKNISMEVVIDIVDDEVLEVPIKERF